MKTLIAILTLALSAFGAQANFILDYASVGSSGNVPRLIPQATISPNALFLFNGASLVGYSEVRGEYRFTLDQPAYFTMNGSVFRPDEGSTSMNFFLRGLFEDADFIRSTSLFVSGATGSTGFATVPFLYGILDRGRYAFSSTIQNFGGNAQMHHQLLIAAIPDAGSTLILLGLGCLGIFIAARTFPAKI